jgi:hypothetical protein
VNLPSIIAGETVDVTVELFDGETNKVEVTPDVDLNEFK